MTIAPFIVTTSVSIDDFCQRLTDALPEALVGRHLSPSTVVVIIDHARQADLAAIPGVTSVTPDELGHTLHGRPAPRVT